MVFSIDVEYSKKFSKQYRIIPNRIQKSVEVWLFTIKRIGVMETRKLKGYHDEPLQGKRFGQRSIRLSKTYRLIYSISKTENKLILLEVNKHEY
jgi:toxin HigB-1